MLVLPKAECSDEALETSVIPTLQPLDLASMAGLSGVGPIETCQSVLSIAGLAEVPARPGSLRCSDSTSPSPCSNSQGSCGRSPSAPPVAASSVAWECYDTQTPIPPSGLASHQHFPATKMPEQVTSLDATTRPYGEIVAHWEGRRDVAVTVGGADALGEGKASPEQTACGLQFFWPHER